MTTRGIRVPLAQIEPDRKPGRLRMQLRGGVGAHPDRHVVMFPRLHRDAQSRPDAKAGKVGGLEPRTAFPGVGRIAHGIENTPLVFRFSRHENCPARNTVFKPAIGNQ